MLLTAWSENGVVGIAVAFCLSEIALIKNNTIYTPWA